MTSRGWSSPSRRTTSTRSCAACTWSSARSSTRLEWRGPGEQAVPLHRWAGGAVHLGGAAARSARAGAPPGAGGAGQELQGAALPGLHRGRMGLRGLCAGASGGAAPGGGLLAGDGAQLLRQLQPAGADRGAARGTARGTAPLPRALESCLLTDKELAQGPTAWRRYKDSFPRWLAAEESP